MAEVYDFNQHFKPSCNLMIADYVKEIFSIPKLSDFGILSLKQKALESLYQLAGVKEEHPFVFTSSGAEAVNQVVFSIYLNITRKIGKNHYITTEIEESPLILSHTRLKELGCISAQAKPNHKGQVTAESIQEWMSPRTALVSLSLASPQTGVINAIEEISKLCKSRGVFLHLDVTHSLGRLPMDFDQLGADFLTFDGSYIGAPEGTGGLFFRKDSPITPFIVGGPEQGSLRGGFFSLPLLAGLGKAAEIALDHLLWHGIESARLREIFESDFLKNISQGKVYFQTQERLPHISLVGIPNVHHEALITWLEKRNLLVNCGGNQQKHLSFLFESLNIDLNERFGGLSFSFSPELNDQIVDNALSILKEGVAHFQKFSTHLD